MDKFDRIMGRVKPLTPTQRHIADRQGKDDIGGASENYREPPCGLCGQPRSQCHLACTETYNGPDTD